MIDWNDAIALSANGALVPARVSGLDLDGKGKGEIGVYIYSKRWLTPVQASQFEPDDIGQDHEYVDELTGKCRYGQIVNVPMDLLPDYIDPKTGKMRMVSELEARRREQAARSAGAPVPAKQRITLDVAAGKATVVGVVAV